jgi:hypothetical protein
MGLTEYFSTPRTNLVPSILEFKLIDTIGMAKRMKLVERGTERGEQNQPTTGMEILDIVEQEIVNEIAAEGTIIYSAYLDSQKSYADRAKRLDIQTLITNLGSLEGGAKADFTHDLHSGKDELYALKRNVIETEQELTRFRHEHGLRRPVRNQGNMGIKWGLLPCIIAAEGVMNGVFLSKGNVFGLAGGIFNALLIAAINVFFGFIVGRTALPYLYHRNIGLKLLGAILAAAYLAIAVAFNLGVAHYRNAIAVDPYEASSLAYNAFMAAPFQINDMESWALFLLGMIFSLAALIDGLKFNDPYPGYGRRYQDNIAALDLYRRTKDYHLQELEDRRDGWEEKLSDLTQTVTNRLDEQENINNNSRILRSRIEEHFAHLDSAGNKLLLIYRDANIRARSAPAPSHFDVPWTYERPSVAAAVVIIENREHLREQAQAALASAPGAQNSLQTAYEAALMEYQRIDQMTAEAVP